MSEPVIESSPRHRRRRFALSLRMLMLLVLVAGSFLGWRARRASIQRRAVAAIERAGGFVMYDFEIGPDGPKVGPKPQPWAPKWLRRAFGDEFFQ
jgi:hypothetical protein